MINVFIVDDSVFMRQVLEDIISAEPDMQVLGQARDGVDALERIRTLKPDVVTLDIAMPRLDGLTCLAKIMEQCPTPVVMVSAWAQDGAEPTIKALELGAIDFITKPAGGPQNLKEIGMELVQKIRAASMVEPARLKETLVSKIGAAQFNESVYDVVVVGTSTGGPRALQALLESLPYPFPAPIVVAQHMPVGFTHALAQRLNVTTPSNVREATDGEPLKNSWTYICPAGLQSMIRREGSGLVLHTAKMDGQIYRPSADILFESAVKTCGDRTAALLLTGMGADGAQGMMAVKKTGGLTIAESEDTCVVYGMPRAAVELGAARHILPLSKIPAFLVGAMARRD